MACRRPCTSHSPTYRLRLQARGQYPPSAASHSHTSTRTLERPALYQLLLRLRETQGPQLKAPQACVRATHSVLTPQPPGAYRTGWEKGTVLSGSSRGCTCARDHIYMRIRRRVTVCRQYIAVKCLDNDVLEGLEGCVHDCMRGACAHAPSGWQVVMLGGMQVSWLAFSDQIWR